MEELQQDFIEFWRTQRLIGQWNFIVLTSHNSNEFAECCPKTQANIVSQLVKAGKRSASEVVSMVHSDKEVASKVKKLLLPRVVKLLHIRPMKPWVYKCTAVFQNIPTNWCKNKKCKFNKCIIWYIVVSKKMLSARSRNYW